MMLAPVRSSDRHKSVYLQSGLYGATCMIEIVRVGRCADNRGSWLYLHVMCLMDMARPARPGGGNIPIAHWVFIYGLIGFVRVRKFGAPAAPASARARPPHTTPRTSGAGARSQHGFQMDGFVSSLLRLACRLASTHFAKYSVDLCRWCQIAAP